MVSNFNRISNLVCAVVMMSCLISAVSIPEMEEETGVHEDAQIEPTSETPSPSPSNKTFAAVARIRDERKRLNSGEVVPGDEETAEGRIKNGKRKGKEQPESCWSTEGDEALAGRKPGNGRKHQQLQDLSQRGKKPGDTPSEVGVPYPGAGGKEAFSILRVGASQMMRQWMTEAKRRYPEDFEKLVTEWAHIMVEFDNISFSDMENQTDAGAHMEASDIEMGSLPDYFKNARYSVMCSSDSGGYEVRKYESTLWINIIVNTSSYDFAGMIAFKRLFEYTQGKNSLGTKIPMTIPLRKQVRSFSGQIDPVSLLRDESFLVSLYLPDEYIDNLPQPLDDEELFLERSDLFVYAFNFSGWAYGLNVYQKYFECSNALAENNEPFEQGLFYMQMYDSPWVINAAERHNELLIPVSCTSGEFLSCTNQEPDHRISQSQIASSSDGLIKIRTISRRREVSLQLLLEGVFIVQRSSLNLTESIYGSDAGCFSRIHPLIQTIYATHNLPYFIKMTQRSTNSNLDCNSCYQNMYYIPNGVYNNFVQPNIISEGSPDKVNPTLYYVMSLPNVSKLDMDDILDLYRRMQSILQTRSYCFSQDEFLVAYHRDHHSLSALELFVPVDLNCSDDVQ